tara:strand:+ start:343 stop:648 length:306 start_codon:yes stop_codon:yes gene_type:complete
MSCSVTTVYTFNIESSFEEWVLIFDSEEAHKRHSDFEITPLYRGISKDDPKKVIVIHQHPDGNDKKFLEANADWIATHKVVLSTMQQSSWTATAGTVNCCD